MREKFEPRLKPKIEYKESKEKKENKEREMIEKSPLFYEEKKDLALTYLKEKPASWIDVSKRYEKTEKNEDEILNQLKSKRDKIQEILDRIGFIYEVERFKTEERTTYNTGYSFTVAKNPEDLSRLKRALKEKDIKEIGLALGYPETAAEAFINKQVLDYNKLPKEESKRLIKEKTSKFLDFRLSKNNWPEELKIVRKQQKLIEEKFPNLYKQITRYGLDRIIEKKLELIEELQRPSDKLKNLLNLIDESIFQENPLPIKIVEKIESKYKEKIPAAQYYFDEDKKGKIFNKHYQVNKEINKKIYDFNDLKSIAIHEVRHRVQHALKLELFNKENIEKFKEIYPALKNLTGDFPKELSPNDFDACMVERLSLFLTKKGVSLSEISENIINKDVKNILENIKELSKKHEFEIPNPKREEEDEKDFSPDIFGFGKLDPKGEEIIKKALEIAPDSFWNRNIKTIEYKSEVLKDREKLKEFGLKELPVAYHTEDSIIFPKKEGWGIERYLSLFPKVLFHENGHLEYKEIKPEDSKTWSKAIKEELPFSKEVTRIKGTNQKSEENRTKQDFAESFACFLLDPESFKNKAPKRFEFFESWFPKKFPELNLEEITKRKDEYFSSIEKLK